MNPQAPTKRTRRAEPLDVIRTIIVAAQFLLAVLRFILGH